MKSILLYTGSPSVLQVPHIRIDKFAVFFLCQIDGFSTRKRDTVTFVFRDVRHIYNIPPVSAVERPAKLRFQFAKCGIGFNDFLRGMDFHFP